jgi:voltage-gated sodium channel
LRRAWGLIDEERRDLWNDDNINPVCISVYRPFLQYARTFSRENFNSYTSISSSMYISLSTPILSLHAAFLQIYARYLMLSSLAENIRDSSFFVSFMTAAICVAAVLVCIETQLAVPLESNTLPGLEWTSTGVLMVFTVEIIVKVVALGPHPLRYFRERWNVFDITVVVLCWLFQLPFAPPASSIVSMLRLLRVLRLLQLAKSLPQLQVLLAALLSGFSSITFVFIILFIFFYIFANIGMLLFARNDPTHFANLHVSLLSLYRTATFDGWSDLL